MKLFQICNAAEAIVTGVLIGAMLVAAYCLFKFASWL